MRQQAGMVKDQIIDESFETSPRATLRLFRLQLFESYRNGSSAILRLFIIYPKESFFMYTVEIMPLSPHRDGKSKEVFSEVIRSCKRL